MHTMVYVCVKLAYCEVDIHVSLCYRCMLTPLSVSSRYVCQVHYTQSPTPFSPISITDFLSCLLCRRDSSTLCDVTHRGIFIHCLVIHHILI